MKFQALALAVAMVAAPAGARAEDVLSLPSGARVRVTLVAGATFAVVAESAYGNQAHTMSPALAAAALGAPIGALIGLAIPPAERWSEVRLDRLRVGFSRSGAHGVTIYATLKF